MTSVARHEDGDAAAIAAAVRAVDGVVALSAGPAGQFRTYLTGGRSVAGVRIDDDLVQVDIVARYGPDLQALGARVAKALADVVGARPVTVTIDDVVLPGEPDDDYLDPDRTDSSGRR